MSKGNTSTTWLSEALKEIQINDNLNDELCDVLRAFGKEDDDAPGPSNLDPDAMNITADALQTRITKELLDEIDEDQARMFGRRFSSVSTLLLEEKEGDAAATKDGNQVVTTTKQLLRLALHRRTVQILSTNDPILSQRKALRIRALVDFIWSQSPVLGLKDDPNNVGLPSLTELVEKYELQSCTSTKYNEFVPGFYHATISDVSSDFGPVHINILRIDMKKSSCQMKCLDARNNNTDLSTLAKEMGAVAAISGGYFLYSEPDIEPPSKRTDPVGLLVENGRTVGPPVFRRAALLQKKNTSDDETSFCMEKLGMEGVTCIFNFQSSDDGPNVRLPFYTYTSLCITLTVGQDSVRCIHRGDANEAIVSEHECAFMIVGDHLINAHVLPYPVKAPVPLAGFVLVFPRTLHPNMIELLDGSRLMPNLTCSLRYELPSPYNNVESAMAGGPMFFSDDCDESESNSMDLPSEDFKGSAPPVTFSQDETHDHNLLPRMGVGIAKCPNSGNDQLVCVAVDGRNLDRALGLTLQGTSNLLRSLGCTKAMNLDGGSSKRMVIYDPKLKKHQVVCLSTTEIKATASSGDTNGSGNAAVEPSRPVHSAILFLPGEEA